MAKEPSSTNPRFDQRPPRGGNDHQGAHQMTSHESIDIIEILQEDLLSYGTLTQYMNLSKTEKSLESILNDDSIEIGNEG